jgi:hypothetical protein
METVAAFENPLSKNETTGTINLHLCIEFRERELSQHRVVMAWSFGNKLHFTFTGPRHRGARWRCRRWGGQAAIPTAGTTSQPVKWCEYDVELTTFPSSPCTQRATTTALFSPPLMFVCGSRAIVITSRRKRLQFWAAYKFSYKPGYIYTFFFHKWMYLFSAQILVKKQQIAMTVDTTKRAS